MKKQPVLILSACLAGVHSRYDGTAKTSNRLNEIINRCRVIIVCPEFSAGMGIPREPFHIDEAGHAITNFTARDLTSQLHISTEKILESLHDDVPFFAVLKSRSPSCDPEYGLFARELRKRFPDIRIYTENTLPEIFCPR